VTCDDILLTFNCLVIATLTCASSAWWGFTSATDRQRLDAFIRRSERSRLIPPNLPSFAELCRTTDDTIGQPDPLQQSTCAQQSSFTDISGLSELQSTPAKTSLRTL